MSKQQDELLTRVDQLLLDVVMPVIEANIIGVDTTLAAAEGTRKVAAFINSEVRAVLDKVKTVDEVHWSEMNLDEVCGSYDEAFEQGGNKQRTKFIDVIEEVRKDYE